MLIEETIIQTLNHPFLDAHRVQLSIKREDLIHPHLSGNKWRKLKYNLLEAKRLGLPTLLTFGGAFSNHIAAVAAAGQAFGLQTIGIIRGEETLPLNPTLAFAAGAGMQLTYMDRETYRHKTEPSFLTQLKQRFGDFYLVPEGGTNNLAVRGCAEILTETDKQAFDFVCTAVGTGGTLAGLASSLTQGQALGFAVLKDQGSLDVDVANLVQTVTPSVHWAINRDYHFGGYARFKPALIDFINTFKAEQGIPLDPIYTGKMMFGIFDLIAKGFFPTGSPILAIHTGGLQGIAGFNERFGGIIATT